jgi:hypothetical protein
MIDHNCLYYREKDEFGPEYCGKWFIGFGDRRKCENCRYREYVKTDYDTQSTGGHLGIIGGESK